MHMVKRLVEAKVCEGQCKSQGNTGHQTNSINWVNQVGLFNLCCQVNEFFRLENDATLNNTIITFFELLD